MLFEVEKDGIKVYDRPISLNHVFWGFARVIYPPKIAEDMKVGESCLYESTLAGYEPKYRVTRVS